MIAVLVNKIISLSLVMAMGWLLIKCKLLKSENSKVVTTISMYLIMPCMILSAFQVECTPEVQQGLLLAVIAAIIIHIIFIILNFPLRKLLKLDAVEQTSIIYSNAGNLIIPLVTAMLGKEWVIYTSAFIVVQLTLLWSHGKSVLCGDKGFSFKKIFFNVNMIAIIVGVIMFFSGLRLPYLISDTVDTVGGMIGPVSMLIMGMVIGGLKLKELLAYKRVWLTSVLRLIIVPVIILPLLKFSGLANIAANGTSVLLVTLLAVAAPSATSITQMSQLYGKDDKYACAINVITTIFCIGTFPLMVYLYQL